jgi:hypothetical protein
MIGSKNYQECYQKELSLERENFIIILCSDGRVSKNIYLCIEMCVEDKTLRIGKSPSFVCYQKGSYWRVKSTLKTTSDDRLSDSVVRTFVIREGKLRNILTLNGKVSKDIPFSIIVLMPTFYL